jgi:hypothetical protein
LDQSSSSICSALIRPGAVGDQGSAPLATAIPERMSTLKRIVVAAINPNRSFFSRHAAIDDKVAPRDKLRTVRG